MRLISVYSPPTFTKPVLFVSTIVHINYEGVMDECETAIKTIEALNNNHALNLIDFSEGNWKRIKNHKTKDEACKYHIDLAAKLSLDYQDHYDTYRDILELPEAKKGDEI